MIPVVVEGPDTSWPAMLIVPSVGFSSPAIIMSKVLLPQPLGPIIETKSPEFTERPTELTASICAGPGLYIFRTPVSRMYSGTEASARSTAWMIRVTS
jgi:hypothetical protein